MIDHATQLLVLVLVAERPSALGELATAAELPKSTASRLLGALERQGLVAQRGARGRFPAGPVLVRFAQRGLPTGTWPSSPSRTCRRSPR